MSCSPCGYNYTSPSQILMTGQHPGLHYPTTNSMPPESLVTQAHPGSSLCSIPYDSRLLGTPYGRYPELYGAAAYPDSVAAATFMGGLAPNHTMLYTTPLTTPYDIKDPRAAWPPMHQGAGYDPIIAAYSYGDRFDPVDSEARRRNATRETTSTLKAWLNEHRKNPYPTKGEKIMLAIITKMTLTQVSTWFANARRRLKKENKMTWEPRNKTGDDMDEDDDDDDKDDQNGEDPKSEGSDINDNTKNHETSSERKGTPENDSIRRDSSSPCKSSTDVTVDDHPSYNGDSESTSPTKMPLTDLTENIKSEDTAQSPEKPKIWSLAQTAKKNTTETSPPQQTDISSRFRYYAEPLYRNDVPLPSPYHRNLPRLPQDSSTESSLSSPPLWRASDIPHGFNPDKFGRATPLDGNDVASPSPSSTGSPVVIPPVLEPSNRTSPNVTYNRMLGNRFIPCGDSIQNINRQIIDYTQFYNNQMSSMGSTLEMRTFHPGFLRTAYPYPSAYSCSPHVVYHPPPTTTLSKSKSEDGTSS